MTPDNAEAKLAFSQVVDWILEQPSGQEDDGSAARTHARRYMWWQADQRPDADVTRLVRGTSDELSSAASSFSASTAAAAAAAAAAPSGLVARPSVPQISIWTGCFFIDLECQPPARPNRGWSAGRLRSDTPFNDFVITPPGSRSIRQRHAYLQLHSTGRVAVRKATKTGADVEVDGEPLSDHAIHLLNNPASRVRFSHLAYRLEYTRFSHTEIHRDKVIHYLRTWGGGSEPSPSLLALTPIPSSTATPIKVGQWQLSNAGTIGTGARGRVSVGVSQAGRVVVLKRFEVKEHRQLEYVANRRKTMERLTHLASLVSEDRILLLVECISDNAAGLNPKADMWLVLQPLVPSNLKDVHDKLSTICNWYVSAPTGITMPPV
jgi:hypothetical protein